ncbi:nucleoside-diphosphate sugar epimerase/dehydratase [Priestia megaterium]|uniref:nucleoside-diphosphate sugar epimerase/dehydratase n=1 Tax=Priestia megaterium TaxID=1404 RepID=UPI003008B426
MNYKKRMSLLMLLDSIIVLGSVYVSYFILHPYFEIFTTKTLLVSSVSLFIAHHVLANVFHLYKKAWSYASIGELWAIFKSVTFSVVVTAIIQLAFFQDIYFRTLFIAWLLHILFIGGSRYVWIIFRNTYFKKQNIADYKRTLIIGAGSAGTMIARQLKTNHESKLYPVAFIDDDVKKHKLEIMGLPVLGGKEVIQDAVKRFNVHYVIIAIPSLKASELKEIYNECAKTQAKTQIMPKIEDIMLGKVSVNQFKDVKVEDLLGREPVELDHAGILETIGGKTVLVTGAGGSIGSEICRQICKFNPRKIILLGHGENSIYTIDMELRQKYQNTIEILPVIADVQDRDRIFEVMDTHKPDVVYHAAAHKHVPLMEYNPKEAVKNNVIGTKNVAEAADTFSVRNFVLISSDKAVNPTNVMGSTKRIAEMVIQELNKHSQTKFVAVRFGNVLGSRGSVIPLFKKQIQRGGPLTVTHPDMTRYFMTIPEASRLVMQAGTLARGGEIFVLDMGEPVKIVDLAKNLIELSGYTEEEIGIKYAGIRPGEKMYEELLGKDEVHDEAIFPKIFIGKSVEVDFSRVTTLVNNYEVYNTEYTREYVLSLANDREGVLVRNAN